MAESPVRHWAYDHTVFAQVANEESMHLLEGFFKLPSSRKHEGAMNMLDDPIKFHLQQ